MNMRRGFTNQDWVFASKCEVSKLYNGVYVTAVYRESVTNKSNNLKECYFQMLASN